MATTTKKVEEQPTSNYMTTKRVEEIMEKERLVLPLKRSEHLWFNGKPGIRRSGIKFAMTKEEMEHYIRCKLSVYYFAENFCKIKLEDGSVGQMHLRDYQKDIIKLYTDNRYSILMASRQVGKCNSFITNVLCIQDNGEIVKKCIGTLYYEEIMKFRSLTFYEKIKIFLYKILERV